MQSYSDTDQIQLYLPKLEIKKALKKISVSGRSRMPDPGKYYSEFANQLTDFFLEFNKTLFLEFYFDYLNTGSSKWLLHVIQFLEKFKNENGGMIEIVWKYDMDDETILETGEVLKSQLQLPMLLEAV